MRVRFAPSPTGSLHVGNARTALFNWLLARGSGGAFVLRIEDTDQERSTRASEASMLEDLRWLGLDWDEGPDIGGDHGPYRQSDRIHLYESYATELLSAGTAYRCFCSAEQLEEERKAAVAAGLPARYSGRCRNLTPDDVAARMAAGDRPAIRFRVPEHREVSFTDLVRGVVSFQTDDIGDPIIVRSDGMPAYNFAVVVDDALMAVTLVVRGEDHISNTPRQILLFGALGFDVPQFAHLSLVMGTDHSPLSKRHGATSVSEFRVRGFLPEALVNYLALIGWSPGGSDELLPIEELTRRFSLSGVVPSPGVFDEEKLAWVNRHYLKVADPVRLANLSLPFFTKAGIAIEPSRDALAFLGDVITIASSSVDRLDQVPQRMAFLFDYSAERALQDPSIAAEISADGAMKVVEALAEELAADGGRLDREKFRATANRIKASTSQKGRALFHPIRIALTGRAEGPELDLVVPAIDRGADLPASAGIPRIDGCRERAAAFAEAARDRLRR